MSIPAVTTTKVWTTVRTTRIAVATSIDRMLPGERNVGLAIWKTTTRTTSPAAAAQSAQKPRSRQRAPSSGARLVVVAVTGGPGGPGSALDQRGERVVEGRERLGRAADGLLGVVLG